MKKVHIIIFIAIILIVVAVLFAGCDWLDPKWDPGEIEFREDGFEVGLDYIKITEIYIPLNDEEVVFRINDGEWQKEPEFYGLEPATEYKISAKTLENKEYYEGKESVIYISTLKLEQTLIPEVSVKRENKVVYIEGFTDGMETKWAEDEEWGEASEKEFEETGNYEVFIRYKENDLYYAGEGHQKIEFLVNDFYDGDGSIETPYIVDDYIQFLMISETKYNGYFELRRDIVFPDNIIDDYWETRNGFEPGELHDFVDGKGFSVINPRIKFVGEWLQAGLLQMPASVKNLNVENAELIVKSNTFVGYHLGIGILAGTAGYIENCNVSGTIIMERDYDLYRFNSWTTAIGGIVGIINSMANKSLGEKAGVIKNCTSDVKMRYTEEIFEKGMQNRVAFGGIAGFALDLIDDFCDYKISECDANVDANLLNINRCYAAGIIGYSDIGEKLSVNIENCYSTGKIIYREKDVPVEHSSGGIFVGGIAGHLSGNVDSCWSSLDIDIIDMRYNIPGWERVLYGGGMVGLDQPWIKTENRKISNCLFTGGIGVRTEEASSAPRPNFETVCISASAGTLDIENCWYMYGLGGSVSEINGTGVGKEEMLTAKWQKETLLLDENVWELTDGQMPVFK